MSVRLFIIGALLTALAAWGMWLMIIMWLDPIEAGLYGYLLFFLTLFLGIASVMALVGYVLRRLLVPAQLPAYRVRYSIRQGILLGLFTDLLLFLQRLRLIRWWLVLLLTVVFICTEFFFLSYDHASRRHTKLES